MISIPVTNYQLPTDFFTMSQPTHILLIEDDEEDYMITRDLLDDIPHRKYRLDWAANFEDALVEINKEAHDAYLLDYRLGMEDGLSLLKAVNALEKNQPFILLTGQDDIELDREAMEAGAADFLVKGDITPNLLERTIRYAIQKKKVEFTLEKEKATAQMYLDITGSLILVLDQEERITLLNQRGEEILGVKEEEVIGKNWFDLFIPQNKREEVRHVFNQLLANKVANVEYYENPVKAKNNQEKIIWWHNRVLFKNGQPIGTISSGVDMTQQRQVEASLKASQLKLQQYADTLELKVQQRTIDLQSSQLKLNEAQAIAQVGHWEWDVQKDEVVFSKGMYRIFDLEEDQVIKPGDMTAYFHPDDQQFIQDKIAEAHRSRQGYSIEHRLITPKDNLKFVHSKVKNIEVSEKGELMYVFGVLRDITQEKEAAQQLEVALEKERELGELKSRFVSMASHEFRTPLSSILSSAELLGMYLETGRHEKCEKNINRIKSSVRNLTGILNDFLSLEKLEAGKVQLQRSTFTLQDYLKELQEEIDPILKKDQQLKTQYPENATLLTDDHLLTNILINLISNAIKYSPNGEDVTLAFEEQPDHWLVKVIDQGIGIPEEDKVHMFSRFFRASNVENIKGTGLGLTIVKRYLDLLGGTIGFDSEYGKGSTFYFTLPLKDLS